MTWHTNKNSEVSTCSQERVEEYLQTLSLDMKSLEPARLKNTQEMSCSPDSETESCQPSQSGTMSAHLTGTPGAEQLTFFAEDSPVRTSVRQVKEQELPGSVRDFGRNMRDSLERCGLVLSLPKTHLCFALGDLELSSKTWPRWGIMLDGELSELGMSVRHINETECGSWPTPRAGKTSDENEESSMKRNAAGKVATPPLTLAVKMKNWPTPAARDYKGANSREHCMVNGTGRKHMDQLPNAVAHGGEAIRQTYPTPPCFMHKDALTDRGKSNLGEVINEKEKMTKTGQLNPPWVEWLMGWPIGWTDLKPLATDKFRNVQLWHSLFSQKD
jgi:hypothetical protein